MNRWVFVLLFLLVGWQAASALAQTGQQVPQSRGEITLSFAPLVKEVAPAVVNIYTKRVVTQSASPFFNDPFLEHFFGRSFGFGGMPRQRVESALGSGVIADPAGLVVTNAHVIAQADEITIGLPDGREFPAGKLIVDEPSDLAVLQMKDIEGETLPSVSLKASEALEVGDLVLAIGNPFGVGQTVTSGIVSAQARSTLDINDFNFFIQTDAAINPGNSGGPLVAMDGSVVGINTAIYSRTGGSLGIGFAIPSEMVATVLAAAKNDGRRGAHGIIRPWLGITVQGITAEIAESLDFNRPYGVLVAGLHPASPVREAGIDVGDIILAVNGREIREPAEMKFRMATVPLGEEATFRVLDNGRERTVEIAAMAPPEKPPRDETTLSGRHPLSGITVANINPAVSIELGLHEERGVVVMDVPLRSQAARIVAPGDIIMGVNGNNIENVDRLGRALRAGGSRGWEFLLSRQGYHRQIVLR